MSTTLIEKARSNRIAALANRSAKLSAAPGRPAAIRAQTIKRSIIWQKEIPVFRSQIELAQRFAVAA
ncbi:MAG: hypothetical protein QNJ16_15020 [Rhodobacter sp.]|nr:hypothetical protein [Rhodobacter sp.]